MGPFGQNGSVEKQFRGPIRAMGCHNNNTLFLFLPFDIYIYIYILMKETKYKSQTRKTKRQQKLKTNKTQKKKKGCLCDGLLLVLRIDGWWRREGREDNDSTKHG